MFPEVSPGEILLCELPVGWGDVVRIALDAHRAVGTCVLTQGQNTCVGKLSHALVKSAKLEFKTLQSELTYPGFQEVRAHVAVPAEAFDCLRGAGTLIEDCFLPQGAD